MARQISDDRVRGLLLDAFVEAFLVEHSTTWKSASRYPLGGARTRQEWRDLLEPEFERWLETTCEISDDERERLLAAPTTVVA